MPFYATLGTPWHGSKFADVMEGATNRIGVRDLAIEKQLRTDSEASFKLRQRAQEERERADGRIIDTIGFNQDEFVRDAHLGGMDPKLLSSTEKYPALAKAQFGGMAHLGCLMSPRVAWRLFCSIMAAYEQMGYNVSSEQNKSE